MVTRAWKGVLKAPLLREKPLVSAYLKGAWVLCSPFFLKKELTGHLTGSLQVTLQARLRVLTGHEPVGTNLW